MKRTRERKNPKTLSNSQKFAPTKIRIVSGELRGRKIAYNGDPATRPMKERTREAVFSLLGGKFSGEWVIDLFGGTGVLAMESVSRGAQGGVVLELARSMVGTMIKNLTDLELNQCIQVLNVDSLRWMRDLDRSQQNWPDAPWVVFCCPPYRMWGSDKEALKGGLENLISQCPAGSQIVCESEQDFDFANEMPNCEWDVREYPPARIAITTT